MNYLRLTKIRHPLIRRVAWAGLLLAAGARLPAAPIANPALFSRATMKSVDLQGLRVWLGQPVQVTSGLGWKFTWIHEAHPAQKNDNNQWNWAFVHLTPFMAMFPGGNLIVTYTLDPDTQLNPVFSSGFQISQDGGLHWGRRYALLMQHNPMVFIPQEDDSLLAIPSEVMAQTPGDAHNLVGPSYLFQHGGDRILTVLDGIHIVGLPFDFGFYPAPQPQANWHSGLYVNGSVALRFGHRLLMAAEGLRKEDHLQVALLLASEDRGYTWRYYSTIAVANPALPPYAEGPKEATLIQLADGDIMSVMRMGHGLPLLRTYSHDEGRTWSKGDSLPARGVKPEIIRSANGVIALFTGRPGLYLWLADDSRARHWQKIDLVAHHNEWAPDPSYRIAATTTGHPTWGQTTSYTGIAEMAPNKLLIVYDRDPEQAPADPGDLSRLFVLPLEIERH